MTRTSAILGASESELKSILVNSPYRAFRVNRLRSSLTHEEIVAYFLNIAITVRQLRWFSDAYIFDVEDTATIQASELAQSGQIFIQNPSSYLPVIALEPTANDSIMDMCSAPGGKASFIASLAGQADNLVANEPKPNRVTKLREVLSLQGADKATIIQRDGRQLADTYADQFDKVLIDAECSTEAGVNFLSKDPLTGWSEARIIELGVLQKQLITAGYDLLKPGGVLVYATCTFAPEENEAVITGLLERRPDATVQPLSFKSERSIRKVKSWNGKHYPDHVSEGVLRVYPSDYMEGFFLARIRKPFADPKQNDTLSRVVSLDSLASEY